MLRYLAFLSITIAPAAWAVPQTYRLPHYPSGGNCSAVAVDVAARFAQTNGIDAFGRCERLTSFGADLAITYDSDEPFLVVSTIGSDVIASSTAGTFATRESCLAELAAEQARFQRETGLAPLVAYCQFTDFLAAYPFALRIDAFGEATKRPWNVWLSHWGSVVEGSRDTLPLSVAQELEARGYPTMYTRAVDELGFGYFGIGYYGVDPVRIEANEWAKVADEVACQAAAAEIKAAFNAFSEPPLATFCTRHAMFSGFRVVNISFGVSSVHASRAIETYSSYAACQADRNRLVEYYRDTLRRPVFGGVCSAAEEDLLTFRTWQVVLIEAL